MINVIIKLVFNLIKNLPIHFQIIQFNNIDALETLTTASYTRTRNVNEKHSRIYSCKKVLFITQWCICKLRTKITCRSSVWWRNDNKLIYSGKLRYIDFEIFSNTFLYAGINICTLFDSDYTCVTLHISSILRSWKWTK